MNAYWVERPSGNGRPAFSNERERMWAMGMRGLESGDGAIAERLRRRERIAIRAAKAGDWEGVHFLYVRYADRVCAAVRGVVGDHHAAEDVTQDVFAKLIRAIGRYEPREVPFGAWITRVARNAAIDHVRARRQIPFEDSIFTDRPHDQGDDGPLEAIKDSMRRLPDSQRDVMVLRYIGGYSPGEIAERLGRSEPSVHALHHRGRQQVKHSLRSLGAAPATAAS